MIRIGSNLGKTIKYLGTSVSAATRDTFGIQNAFTYKPTAGFASNQGGKDPYDILGVNKSASQDEIKRAYFALAHKYHPDKGGDPEKFKEVQGAYEILGNPERRQTFDQFGMEGVANEGNIDPFSDIFASFFGGGGRSRRSGPPKTAPIQKTLSVKLETFYHGDVIHYPFARKKNCENCKGYGSTKTSQCPKCKGAGVVAETRSLAPGFIQQVHTTCSRCSGSGIIKDMSHSCTPCGARGQLNSQNSVNVVIAPGMPDDTMVFEGEGNEEAGHAPGDVIIKLVEEKHPIFTRNGADLYIKKKITLYEALTGVYFQIDHLDGTKIDVMTQPGEIVKPGTKKQLTGKGMPLFNNPHKHGNLYIDFEIEFPKKGEIKEPEKLKGVLPGSERTHYSPEKQYVTLQNYQPHSENPNPKGGKEEPRVQCNQQ